MARDSVFYKVVKDENSFTELLCNLLMREGFRAQVLPLLVPELLPSGICAVGISTQELLDCGRPDIVIRTAEICALIEVKLNPGRGFTVHQEIIGCEDPDIETYVSYLDRQNVSHKRLMFLVPADWAHREELKTSFAEVKKAYRKIEIGIFFWEEILSAIETNVDPIVQEFKTVLQGRLGLLQFSQEEKEMMASENFPAAFRVVRKLEMMIDKIVKLVQRDSTRAVWERAEESYGVYFKAGNKDFLWFGLWNFDGRVNLCYAVSHKWDAAILVAFRNLFRAEELHDIGSDERWTTFRIPDHILTGKVSLRVEEIRGRLNEMLDKLPDARIEKSTRATIVKHAQ